MQNFASHSLSKKKVEKNRQSDQTLPKCNGLDKGFSHSLLHSTMMGLVKP